MKIIKRNNLIYGFDSNTSMEFHPLIPQRNMLKFISESRKKIVMWDPKHPNEVITANEYLNRKADSKRKEQKEKNQEMKLLVETIKKELGDGTSFRGAKARLKVYLEKDTDYAFDHCSRAIARFLKFSSRHGSRLLKNVR